MKNVLITIAVIVGLSTPAFAGEHEDDIYLNDLQNQIVQLSTTVMSLASQLASQAVTSVTDQLPVSSPVVNDANGTEIGKLISSFTARAKTDTVTIIDASNVIKTVSVDGQLISDETTTVAFITIDCSGSGYTSSFNNKASGTIFNGLDGSWWTTSAHKYASVMTLSYIDANGTCVQHPRPFIMPRSIAARPYTGPTTYAAPLSVVY